MAILVPQPGENRTQDRATHLRFEKPKNLKNFFALRAKRMALIYLFSYPAGLKKWVFFWPKFWP